ncbi:MAG: hypothetical protein ACRYFR_14200 [Janthinobacterium lividum]
MSELYDDFADTAEELIAEFGRDITLLNRQNGGFDFAANRVIDGTDTMRTVRAVFTDYKAKDIDGTVIRQGDKLCLVAGAVDAREILMDGTDQYAIISIEAVQPGDTLILSKVQVRR